MLVQDRVAFRPVGSPPLPPSLPCTCAAKPAFGQAALLSAAALLQAAPVYAAEPADTAVVDTAVDSIVGAIKVRT